MSKTNAIGASRCCCCTCDKRNEEEKPRAQSFTLEFLLVNERNNSMVLIWAKWVNGREVEAERKVLEEKSV